MITKSQFDRLYDENITKKEYDYVIREIDKRFDYICKAILNLNCQGRWYDYGNADYDNETHTGCFDPEEYKEYIEITGGNISPKLESFDLSFPTRWLWEDFEEEFKNMLEKEKADKQEKIKKKKEQKAESLKRREMIKNQIKAKLTPEEFKMIRFK